MNYKRLAACGLALLVSLCIGGTGRSLAGTGISIAPTRVIMDGGSRISTVYLSNNGDRPVTYRVMLRDKRMLETGQIADLAEGETVENSALELIRYSPRRVTVPAFGNQTVRLKLQNPSGASLDRGEYRTHLVFQSVPGDAPDSPEGTIQARAIIETSIPVIIRRDKPDATVSLGEAWVDTTGAASGRPALYVRLGRSGQRSIYGDVTVDWRHGRRGEDRLATISGLAVYYPTPARVLRIPLNLPDGDTLDEGDLLIDFQETAAGHGDLGTNLILPLEPEAFASR